MPRLRQHLADHDTDGNTDDDHDTDGNTDDDHDDCDNDNQGDGDESSKADDTIREK